MLSKSIREVHLIGVGGSGMSAIAWVLIQNGIRVSGSDLEQNSQTARLSEAGARILVGHSSANLDKPDVVVYSTAIPRDNAELQTANLRGIPIWRRAEMLAAILESRRTLIVVGAHGKTTTTSMVGLLFARSGLDPTVLVGGELNDFGGNARVGQSDLAVAEGDESDGSFLLMPTDTAIVTNIEADHLDYWKDYESLMDGYVEFLQRIRPGGKAIVNIDCPGVREALGRTSGQTVSFALDRIEADWQARAIHVGPEGSSFRCVRGGEELGEVKLSLPGRHNVANALAALAAAVEHGVDFETCRPILADYRGAGRRWELVGEEGGVRVIDDYAHHPTEVSATLAAARASQTGGNGRVICVFQPHRYSRTMMLSEKFGSAFCDADLAVLTDIYSAGEEKIEGVGPDLIFDSVRRQSSCESHYLARPEQIISFLSERARPGDIVLTMGAGDVWRIGAPLLEALRHRSAPAAR